MDWNFIIFSVVKVAVVIGALLTLVAYSVLAERKIAAWIQDRARSEPLRTAVCEIYSRSRPVPDSNWIFPADGGRR